MKTTAQIFSFLCLITALTACGKSDDQPVATTSGVAANSCATGQVYSPQYGCAPAQYGYPQNGYNGGQNWQPVSNVQWPSGGCQSGYYQYPYGGGYGQHGGCQRQRSYTVYYYGGYYYYY